MTHPIWCSWTFETSLGTSKALLRWTLEGLWRSGLMNLPLSASILAQWHHGMVFIHDIWSHEKRGSRKIWMKPATVQGNPSSRKILFLYITWEDLNFILIVLTGVLKKSQAIVKYLQHWTIDNVKSLPFGRKPTPYGWTCHDLLAENPPFWESTCQPWHRHSCALGFCFRSLPCLGRVFLCWVAFDTC